MNHFPHAVMACWLTAVFLILPPAAAPIRATTAPDTALVCPSKAASPDAHFTVFGPALKLTNSPEEPEQWPSLAIDSAGNPHLVYEAAGSIYYRTSRCGTFGPPALLSVGIPGAQRPAIAVDRNGKAHVVFWREVLMPPAHYDIYYTSNTGGAFSPPVVIGSADWGSFYTLTPAVAVDTAGQPHIVFASGKQVLYVTRSGGAFSTPVPIAGVGADVSVTDLAIDPSGTLHVLFGLGLAALPNGALYYVSGRPGVFGEPVKITDWGAEIFGCSIAADSAGHAHVTYVFGGTSEVYYATNASGTFNEGVWVGYEAEGPAIALDRDGRVHVGLASGKLLGYSNNRSGDFRWSGIASHTGFAANAPIPAHWFQVDTSLRGHMVYQDAGDLYYRRADVSLPLPALVDAAPNPDSVDTLPVLALDRWRNVHIAYMSTYPLAGAPDGVTTDIFYTTNRSGSFATPVKVPAPASAGGFYSKDISLAVDDQGNAHLVFVRTDQQTSGLGRLVYASNADGPFQSQELPLAWGEASSGGSVAVAPSGDVHIAYNKGLDIYYTSEAAGAFPVGDRISADVSFATEPRLAFAPDGHAHIAFMGYRVLWQQQVYYVDNTTGTFSSPLDVSQDPQSGPSHLTLDVDKAGTSHVAFRKTMQDGGPQLFYANNASGSFAPAYGVPDTDWAHHLSLVAGGAGEVYIAFLSGLNDVWLADNQNGSFRLRRLTSGAGTYVPGQRWLGVDDDGVAHLTFYDFGAALGDMDPLYLAGSLADPPPLTDECRVRYCYLPIIIRGH